MLRLGRNTLLAITVLHAVALVVVTVVPRRVTADKSAVVNVVALASVAAYV